MTGANAPRSLKGLMPEKSWFGVALKLLDTLNFLNVDYLGGEGEDLSMTVRSPNVAGN